MYKQTQNIKKKKRCLEAYTKLKKDKNIIMRGGEGRDRGFHKVSDTSWSLKAKSSKSGKVSEGVTANNNQEQTITVAGP